MRTTITNRMMIGASLLMMTFSFATKTNAETCTQVPTCAELGYTETNCGLNMALKCPFDQTKLFCGKEKCKAGDIYYSDNTCSSTYSNNKTVVGVVAGNRFLVDITASKKSWQKAVDYCDGITKGGKKSRLPTMEELKIMSLNFAAIQEGLAKVPEASLLSSGCYWSSYVYQPQPEYRHCFDVGVAEMYMGRDQNERWSVRCVFDY